MFSEEHQGIFEPNNGRYLRFMTNMSESRQTLRITALPVADLARVLAAAYGRRVTAEQVQAIVDAGSLLNADGTVNLLRYVAFLAQEASNAASD
jgi:Zn-finger domain-containing protein